MTKKNIYVHICISLQQQNICCMQNLKRMNAPLVIYFCTRLLFIHIYNNKRQKRQQQQQQLVSLRPHNEQQLPHATGRAGSLCLSERRRQRPKRRRRQRQRQRLERHWRIRKGKTWPPFVGVTKLRTVQSAKCNSKFRFGQEITSLARNGSDRIRTDRLVYLI